MNGTVYISIVERFSEIVLYDEKGVMHNTSTEMHRISSRFSPSTGSRSCAALDGGFEAFRALFPFICTQSDIRSTVDREKFLTIYPSVVLDNQLYLGKQSFTKFSLLSNDLFPSLQAPVIKQLIGKSFVI